MRRREKFIKEVKDGDALKISEKVLDRLITIGYEKNCLISSGQLIFPTKKDIKRISEQELRQLFIEVFKEEYNNLYYSIETPTAGLFSFTNESKEIKVGDGDHSGQSALLDMCVFEKKDEKSEYKRLLNIEFKHKNATHDNISKDILKLMHEEQNGVFILLLKNTDNGTLINNGDKRKGVLDKFCESFVTHKEKWKGDKDKFIQLIILSLEEKKTKLGTPFLINYKIRKGNSLEDNFFIECGSGIKTEIKGDDWKIATIK